MKSIEKVEKFAQQRLRCRQVYHLSGEGAFEVLAQARKLESWVKRLFILKSANQMRDS